LKTERTLSKGPRVAQDRKQVPFAKRNRHGRNRRNRAQRGHANAFRKSPRDHWRTRRPLYERRFCGLREIRRRARGLEIDVPEDLVDVSYPDDNWGYQTFKVSKGLQTFDGATALKYARSRHSTSDFDRSLRQQSLVRALKEKLLSLGTLSKPSKIQSLYSALSSHIRTDLSLREMAALALFAKELPSKNILSFNLNDSCFQSVSSCDRGGILYTPARDLFNGASVLLPDGGDSREHLGIPRRQPVRQPRFQLPGNVSRKRGSEYHKCYQAGRNRQPNRALP
jgi:hypothetical protein